MRFSALVLCISVATLFGQEPAPPVYFNHADIVVDPAIYDALAQANFLKDEFSGFREITVQRTSSNGYTFLGVFGRRTYLSIFKPIPAASPTDPLNMPKGQTNFNMWVDDRTKLPLVRDSLAKETHTKATVGTAKRLVNGQIINAFDVTRAAFPNQSGVRAATSVISMYADFFHQQHPELKPEQYALTRENDQSSRYNPERLLNDITSFTLTVNNAECEQLLQAFRAYGFTIRTDRERQIAAGPEITFVLLNTEPDSPRKLAIEMKVNRAKTGEPRYQFGAGSELVFKGETATWYFPAGWRP
jgi:hypothetical protein